jgi:hypothetical protein
MHVDVRITGSKDPTVPIRIEAMTSTVLAGAGTNFGFFVKLEVVWKAVALFENVERRTLRCRVDQKREGLTDIDAKFRRELHDRGL